MKKGMLTSLGSVVLAVLATQHHNLHVLLLTLGVGAAGMTLLADPLFRRGMLVLSLVAVGMTIRQAMDAGRPVGLRVAATISAIVALGLMAWSVAQFGV